MLALEPRLDLDRFFHRRAMPYPRQLLRDTLAHLWVAPPLERVAFLERWCESGAAR
jgi:hypothetical protein